MPPHAQRLAWLTGFTGSAGTAVVLREHAAIFVDGRYTVQARREVDTERIAVCYSGETTPADWMPSTTLAANAPEWTGSSEKYSKLRPQ